MTPAAWNFVVVEVDSGTASAEVAAYAAAQQRQVREHFAPTWQLPETSVVRVAANQQDVQPGEVEVRLLKNPTMQGAIAYHAQKPDGTPICYVFVGLSLQLGQPWTVPASHEVLETLGDPRLRRCVEMMTDGSIWDTEVCDRVEQDWYQIDGVWLSNFNTPECFEPDASPAPGTKFDWLGKSTAPNQVRPGGYAQKYAGTKWSQVGQMSAYRQALADLGLGRVTRRAGRRKRSWVVRLWHRVARHFRHNH